MQNSFRAEFGKLCAHFAAAFVAMVALIGVVALEPMILVWVLGVIVAGNLLIGLAVYLEMHRKEKVQGKGGREVP